MAQLHGTPQTVTVPPFYDYTSYMSGLTTPMSSGGGALNEFQEATRRSLFERMVELEGKRNEQLQLFWETYQKQNEAAMQTFTDTLSAMAEFAKAGAMAAEARSRYMSGNDSPVAQAAARYLFAVSDPAAVSDANKTVALGGNTAMEQIQALKAAGQPITPEMLLDQSTAALTDMNNALRSGVATAADPASRMGTARDIERQILTEFDRVARASGMSTEQQIAYMQAIRQRVQGASLEAVPPEERAAFASNREAAGQFIADTHQVAETLRTAGGDSSKAAAMEAALATIEEISSPEAQMERARLYQHMVSPSIDADLKGIRNELDAMTGGAGDPLEANLADFAKEHPWYQQWAQAMHFPDHAFAANWLVKRPELITQMDSFYKANADLFSRASHNMDAERELRQALKQEGRDLREAGEGSPAFQTSSVVRTLDDMFRRKQLSTLPDPEDPQSWGSAFTRGYEERMRTGEEKQRNIAYPPSAEEIPVETSGAIKPPSAPSAPTAPLAPGVQEADRQRIAAARRAKEEAARRAAAPDPLEAARKQQEAEEEARRKAIEEATRIGDPTRPPTSPY